MESADWPLLLVVGRSRKLDAFPEIRNLINFLYIYRLYYNFWFGTFPVHQYKKSSIKIRSTIKKSYAFCGFVGLPQQCNNLCAHYFWLCLAPECLQRLPFLGALGWLFRHAFLSCPKRLVACPLLRIRLFGFWPPPASSTN